MDSSAISRSLRIVDGADAADKRRKVIALFSQMVGALMLSRAVQETNPVLSDQILAYGRDDLLAAIGDS